MLGATCSVLLLTNVSKWLSTHDSEMAEALVVKIPVNTSVLNNKVETILFKCFSF